jgi:hypothetical protein
MAAIKRLRLDRSLVSNSLMVKQNHFGQKLAEFSIISQPAVISDNAITPADQPTRCGARPLMVAQRSFQQRWAMSPERGAPKLLLAIGSCVCKNSSLNHLKLATRELAPQVPTWHPAPKILGRSSFGDDTWRQADVCSKNGTRDTDPAPRSESEANVPLAKRFYGNRE